MTFMHIIAAMLIAAIVFALGAICFFGCDLSSEDLDEE